MLEMIDGGIWTRQSPTKDASDSPIHHLARCRGYCKAENVRVVEEYTSIGISGADVINTPEGQRMLQDVRLGRIKVLVFSHPWRLFRNTRQALEIADIFEECGAKLISLDFHIDLTSAQGRLMFTMVAAMGEAERKEIADRQARSIPIRAELGKSTGGSGPYGYQWVDKRLAPHPENAAVVLLIFQLYKEYRRYLTVAKELNQRLYKPPRAKTWSGTMVRHIILNPVYKGKRKTNYLTSIYRAKNGNQAKPESEWVWQTVPEIVPAELWDECYQLSGTEEKPARASKSPFAGLLECGCGVKMYADSHVQTTRKYRCAQCKSAVKVQVLEILVRRHLQVYFSNPEAQNSYAGQLSARIRQNEALVAARRREVTATERELEQLKRDYRSGELSARRYDLLADEAEERINTLQIEIATVTGAIDALETQRLQSEQAIQRTHKALLQWDAFDSQGKRDLLHRLCKRLVWDQGQLQIDLEDSDRLAPPPTTPVCQHVEKHGSILPHVDEPLPAIPVKIILSAWLAFIGLLTGFVKSLGNGHTWPSLSGAMMMA